MAKPKRIRRVGGLHDARKELWRAIICTREVLKDPQSDANTTLKAAHALQQCVSSYVRLLETSTLKDELDAPRVRIDELQENGLP